MLVIHSNSLSELHLIRICEIVLTGINRKLFVWTQGITGNYLAWSKAIKQIKPAVVATDAILFGNSGRRY